MKRKNLFITIGVVGTLLACVAFIPLPYRIVCSFEVKARDAGQVYVKVPGILSDVPVKPGQPVTKGDLLAQLRNPDVEIELARLQAQYSEDLKSLENLRRIQFRDPTADGRIRVFEETLPLAEQEIKAKQRDLDSLRLLAPIDGYVLPPPETPARDTGGEEQLPGWSGTPLETKNRGCLMSASTLFCQVGDPREMEAVLVIDQSDMSFIAEGQVVELMLDQAPSDIFESKIDAVARTDLKYASKQLSNKSGGELATKTDESGGEQPISVSYQARAPLDAETGILRPGLRGTAKVHVRPQSLGQRLYRFCARTFNFEL